MAAPREGGRGVAEADHQRPWMVGGNINHMLAAAGNLNAEWEREVKRLSRLGVPMEEIKQYKRSVTSNNQRVNKWNDEIISCLNDIVFCRCKWYEMKISGNVNEIAELKGKITKLKRQISDIQKWIKKARGHAEQLPDLFHSDPNV